PALLEHRHLAERLQLSVRRRGLVLRPDEAFFVGEAGLFERPTHAQVAHETLRKGRNPAKGRDGDVAHVELLETRKRPKESSTWLQPWPWLWGAASPSNGACRKSSRSRLRLRARR